MCRTSAQWEPVIEDVTRGEKPLSEPQILLNIMVVMLNNEKTRRKRCFGGFWVRRFLRAVSRRSIITFNMFCTRILKGVQSARRSILPMFPTQIRAAARPAFPAGASRMRYLRFSDGSSPE